MKQAIQLLAAYSATTLHILAMPVKILFYINLCIICLNIFAFYRYLFNLKLQERLVLLQTGHCIFIAGM